MDKNKLSGKATARIVVFTLMIGFLALYMFLASFAYYSDWDKMHPVSVGDTDSVYVDGADCSGFFKIAEYGAGGLVVMISVIACVIGELLSSVILILPLRFISLRKDTVVDPKEYKITKIIFVAVICVSVAVCLLVTMFKSFIMTLFTGGAWIGISLIYFLTLRSKVPRKGPENVVS